MFKTYIDPDNYYQYLESATNRLAAICAELKMRPDTEPSEIDQATANYNRALNLLYALECVPESDLIQQSLHLIDGELYLTGYEPLKFWLPMNGWHILGGDDRFLAIRRVEEKAMTLVIHVHIDRDSNPQYVETAKVHIDEAEEMKEYYQGLGLDVYLVDSDEYQKVRLLIGASHPATVSSLNNITVDNKPSKSVGTRVYDEHKYGLKVAFLNGYIVM